MKEIDIRIDGVESKAHIVKEYGSGSLYNYTLLVDKVKYRFQWDSQPYTPNQLRTYMQGYLFKGNKIIDCYVRLEPQPITK